MEKLHRIRVELIGPEGRVDEICSCQTSRDIAAKGLAAISKEIEAVQKDTADYEEIEASNDTAA